MNALFEKIIVKKYSLENKKLNKTIQLNTA